ncbi:arginine--tRNA ligase [Ruminiclostridium hungatei]|uniref:Arginine--tRNA ligase n=1 Tax=Ruminiclostridium hungatei TaxID=48256 RepID=A0A1V4SGA1_RUMHU|nr:arginine--tRNA ligase [Ruminiclostridium hungatei]OPX42898.1 arginine--tRNA ligase [Ruminiclostridium hungatei]
MKRLTELIADAVGDAFYQCSYSPEYGLVTLSNRPDLCQFQCNGALTAAKAYKKAPIIIADEITKVLKEHPEFKEVTSVMPGFINITMEDSFIVSYLNAMTGAYKYGCEEIGDNKTIIVDYGGPNVAKPLHVGHLRTAIIGESIKRIGRFIGYKMLGDVHLGDWGLQIGLIIAELKRRSPELIYFEEDYEGEFPMKAPFSIAELEEIYPAASSRAKINTDFMEEAKQATFLFQQGHRGYIALWEHILNASIEDLKKNYADLNVYFDLWKKESDAQPYIPKMIEDLKNKGFAYLSEGALVVDVKEDGDTKDMPPCILVKSDGATLYSTTDLATIIERMELYCPQEIVYIVDKRQELHFEQVFRCAKKAKLVSTKTKLTFLGFGTMNGKDGKPFKTRDGGVMRLEQLIKEARDKVCHRVTENKAIPEEEAKEISRKVGVAALKYSDLSNQISKDYMFDVDRFTSSEGNTGPYIIYTVVRIKSILNRFYSMNSGYGNDGVDGCIQLPCSGNERNLMLKLTQFNEVIINSFIDYSPHKICQFIYDLSNEVNRFYYENRIISEQNPSKQTSWIKLISLGRDILVTCLDLLGIEVPDRM